MYGEPVTDQTFLYEKRKREIALTEARATYQFKLQAVKVEKIRKHVVSHK